MLPIAAIQSYSYTDNHARRRWQTFTSGSLQRPQQWPSSIGCSNNIEFVTQCRMYTSSLIVLIPLCCVNSAHRYQQHSSFETAFKTKCLRKLLRISYKDHKTKDAVQSAVAMHVGPREPYWQLGNGAGWSGSAMSPGKMSRNYSNSFILYSSTNFIMSNIWNEIVSIVASQNGQHKLKTRL